MSNEKYTIGLDYGSLSARALLVRVSDGKIMAEACFDYPHAVMDTCLPGSDEVLPPDFALQHPQDYLDALDEILPTVIKNSGVDPEDVIGICVDFTTCTVIPVLGDGTPVCFLDEYKNEPHAYAKLWKHHAAQPYADRLTALAEERGEEWLSDYGGKVSSEWMFPKIWEVLDRAPDIYALTDGFVEGGDFITRVLTGKRTKGYVFSTSKAIYDYYKGYPSKEFFAALDPRLENVVEEKLNAPMVFSGECAGYICDAAAKRFGISQKTAVASPMPDAHIATVALNMKSSGDLCAILGTSACYMLLGEKYVPVKGISGIHKDSLTPGFYGYEAGLCCFGDHFAWVAENVATEEYVKEAESRGISMMKLLTEKAAKKKPGESGLLALNWWNGNRSVLVDSALSGMILGMDLRTKPEDIMRALLEANTFGTRLIVETYESSGLEVKRIIAGGGIPQKNPFIMQLFADVIGKEIWIAGTTQLPALSGAIYAAAAAGVPLTEAMDNMSSISDVIYRPNPEATAVYDKLYEEYKRLYDYFGRGENNVMKTLRKIREEA